MSASWWRRLKTLLPLTGGHAVVSVLPSLDAEGQSAARRVAALRRRTEIGSGESHQLPLAVIGWLQRALTQVALRVVDRQTATGQSAIQQRAQRLLDQPNPLYDGVTLLQSVAGAMALTGMTYLHVDRQPRGDLGLQWIPTAWLRPIFAEDKTRILAWRHLGLQGRILQVEDVLVRHYLGLDPNALWRSRSPLEPLIDELWADTEAAIYVAELLGNGGVVGSVISPRLSETMPPPSPRDLQATREYIDQRLGREQAGRGKTVVLSSEAVVSRIAIRPDEMDLSVVRDVAEERVCAALGIPAAVVGLGTGMQTTRVGATMQELHRIAWESGVLPIVRAIAATLTAWLQRDLSPRLEVTLDLSGVQALTEDTVARETRLLARVTAGVMTVADAQEALGLPVDPTQQVYLRSIATVAESAQRARSRTASVRVLPRAKDHSAFEHRMGEEAPHVVRAPARLARLAAAVDRIQARMVAQIEPQIARVFADHRDAILALDLLAASTAARQATAHRKDRLDELLARAGIADRQALYRQLLAALQQETAVTIHGVLEEVGLVVGAADRLAEQVLATGGSRAGLLDLAQETRAVIAETLAAGRAEGLGAEDLARRLTDRVDMQFSRARARMIARTESTFARNASMLAGAQTIDGVTHALVFDARLGPTDEVCEALDGAIVTLAEAQQLMRDEHPNGTRSFTPIPASMLADLLEQAA